MQGDSFIKKLMTSTKCALCGRHYEVDNISILARDEDLWIMQTSCYICGTQCLLAAVVREDSTPEFITDLTEAELDEFESVGEVTDDDILDMHHFLEDFKGDFSRLFEHGRT